MFQLHVGLLSFINFSSFKSVNENNERWLRIKQTCQLWRGAVFKTYRPT